MARQAANDNVPQSSSIRFKVDPRLVPADKAARRLHLTPAEFANSLAALFRIGFPSPCPVTGHYDLKAVDAWLDRRAGLVVESAAVPMAIDDFERRLEALG